MNIINKEKFFSEKKLKKVKQCDIMFSGSTFFDLKIQLQIKRIVSYMENNTVSKDTSAKSKAPAMLHIFTALAAALLFCALAVMKMPLYPKMLSPVKWVFVILIPFISLFLFYLLIKKPRRSVFRSAKYIYLIASPAAMLLMINVVFDPAKAEYYSQNFSSAFLPGWAALWCLGMTAVYLIMVLIRHTVHNGYQKGSFWARTIYALAVMYTPQKTLDKKKRQGRAGWAAASVCMVFIALGVFIGTVTMFLHGVYSNMEFEAILFTVRFAAGGLALEDLLSGFALTVFFALVTGYLCYHAGKCFGNDEITVADASGEGKYTLRLNKRKRSVHVITSSVLLVVCITLFSAQTHFVNYLNMKFSKSDLYENYYVKPDESILTFPEKKRNLIYIYLESIENTYASKQEGGSQEKNYMAELTALTKDKDSVSFSNTGSLGGASVYVPSITFTQGSTVAQTSGVSLNTKIFPPYTAKEFPSTVRLEDILHDNGYEQLYIEGSKGEFSMYDKYVGRYENSKVFDRKTASDQGYTDENADYIWKWGIEDRKLIDVTKDLITQMSKKDKPFFVTMYTMDTHTFECGHRCPNCDSSINSDYLASVDCCSKMISGFVDWIKQQPFYENTTIILVGDHLGNKKTTLVDIDEDYVRTTYNCIINPAKKASKTTEREFSSLDMFPTTLSAIGVEINGDRLGLGTDLFSKTKTLCEELGTKEYINGLERSSEYYDKEFYPS